MAPAITPVQTASTFSSATTVVVIGGGIVGLTAALTLAERHIPVVLLEKGQLAGEQSSRNLGWVRKTSRVAEDIPLAQASDRLWAAMRQRTGYDVGYRQAGIMFIARTQAQMAMHEGWLQSVAHLNLDSHLLSARQIAQRVPGGRGAWAGGIFTPSDGRAEPTLASSAIAKAAIAKGVTIVENCAVRSLVTSGGKVSGVVTEKGEIRCEQVLLAGGLWSGNPPNPASRPFSILNQAPIEKTKQNNNSQLHWQTSDNRYSLQRGALDASLTLDHLLIGMRYLAQLRAQRSFLRISLGRNFLRDLAMPRRWHANQRSPFERLRMMNPPANLALNAEAMANLISAWPAFEKAEIADAWAGVIDVTPDSNPVIGPVARIPGLTLATGFSGHGFGTSPAAGQLAADIVSAYTPIIDPKPYCFTRF
ncbi:FAD-binding oxidoreductase [Erwinia pyrifoliae]|uniref:NAD(P)/FAD-dependent oxidoreductase n=1 Tax=Erwinia pyrifoliae TaxID=79967 RepID=UPI0034D9561C